MSRGWFRTVACLAAATACAPAVPAPSGPGGGEIAEADRATTHAAAAIDESRCQQGDRRLTPFVINWDATRQAELSAATEDSLVVVKMSGCSLDLVPSCRVPGEYRFRETSGNEQRLYVSSQDDLYAKLPLSVAELGATIGRKQAVSLRYFVRGVRYATAPALYRSQLGPGCEQATHFLLNYATGAYELDVAKDGSRGASAAALGAAAGARHADSRRVLYRAGNFGGCTAGARCDAPVRLRLLPILPGEPPEALRAALARATSAPRAGAQVDMTEDERVKAIQASADSARPGFRACYKDQLGRKPAMSGTMKAVFHVAADGVVSNLDLVVHGDFDDAFIDCCREVLYGVRFPSAEASATIKIPVTFKP